MPATKHGCTKEALAHMIMGVDALELHALREAGWSISAIARHVGHDRKTVRPYLSGERQVGERGGRAGPVGAVRRLPAGEVQR